MEFRAAETPGCQAPNGPAEYPRRDFFVNGVRRKCPPGRGNSGKVKSEPERRDWVVVDAGWSERVSEGGIPAIRESTGNFTNSGPIWAACSRKEEREQQLTAEFPAT